MDEARDDALDGIRRARWSTRQITGLALWGLHAVAATACSPPALDIETTTTSGTSTTTGTTTAGGTSSETTIASSASDSLATLTPVDSSFLVVPDVGIDGSACDQWTQDCPPGFKCTPMLDATGSGQWANRCSPVDPDPKRPGEPCTAPNGAIGGIDDCEVGAMCWYVDPETNLGRCVSQCKGTEANPVCTDPCTGCSVASESILILCLEACDPMVQDCGEGQGCYAVGNWFSCAPDLSQDDATPGDACEFIGTCAPGTFCADADELPNCAGAGCCTPYCSLDEADDCDSIMPGTICTSHFGDASGIDACLASGRIGACLGP